MVRGTYLVTQSPHICSLVSFPSYPQNMQWRTISRLQLRRVLRFQCFHGGSTPTPNSPSVLRHRMQNESGGAAGSLGSFGGRQVGVPSVSVKAIAVDLVGLARHNVKQWWHHLVRLDQFWGAAIGTHVAHFDRHAGRVGPGPGFTMFTVRPLPSTSLAHTSVA